MPPRTGIAQHAFSVFPNAGTSRVRQERSETRSLTLEDLNTVREALRGWTAKQRPEPEASSDMADIIDLMLATGARIAFYVSKPEIAADVAHALEALERTEDD